MKAHQFAPIEPLDTEPFGALTPVPQRREAFLDALRGVELGRYDDKLIEWLLERLDLTAIRALVSLLVRARAAAIEDAVEAERLLRSRPRRPNVRAIGRAQIPGNEGPNF